MQPIPTSQPTGGARQVLFLRHGEGVHNATNDWTIVDPSLTPAGEAQADALAGSAVLADCELLVVSPLRRAIETAIRALPWCGTWSATAAHGAGTPGFGRRVMLLSLHSERWSAPCDEGQHKHTLAETLPCVRGWEGFSELADEWSPTQENDRNWKQERVPQFKQWLAEQPERRIVVVGHGAFFQECLGRHLRNCEVARFEEEPTATKLPQAVRAAKAGDWGQLQQLVFSEGRERALSDAAVNSIPEGASYGLLHQIAWHGAEEPFKLLVSKGVNFDLTLLTQRSRSGKPPRTAQEVARGNGQHAFADFLDTQLQAAQPEPEPSAEEGRPPVEGYASVLHLADQVDAIHISESDRQQRNAAYHHAVARKDSLVARMRAEIKRVPGFEKTAYSWLLSSSGGKKAGAMWFFANNADSSALSFFLYMLQHEPAFVQYHLLLAIQELMDNLHFDQFEALRDQLVAYVSTCKAESSRAGMSKQLISKLDELVQRGPTEFHARHRLGGATLVAQGARFLSLWQKHASVANKDDVALLSEFRCSLDAPTFDFFCSLATTCPDLNNRVLMLWTSENPACYKQMNDVIIHERDNLPSWMPLIVKLIFVIRRSSFDAATTTYRGSKLSAAQMETYTVGSSTALGMFVASSLDESVAQRFATDSAGNPTGPVIEFRIPAGCTHAMVVPNSNSFFKDEQEVLIAPYTLVKCLSKTAGKLILEVLDASQLDMAVSLG